MWSRSSMSDLLANVRDNPSLLLPNDNHELVSFTVSVIRTMGLKRAVGKRSFIDSVLDTFDDFYGDVVQHLQGWQPPAPKLPKTKTDETVTEAEGEVLTTSSSKTQERPNVSLENGSNNVEDPSAR
jgi:hypothetical protein